MQIEYTKELLLDIIKQCNRKSDFCRKLGLNPTGGNYRTVDNIIKKYNLNTDHFTIKPWNAGKKYKFTRYDLSEILVENTPITNNNSLKNRLINAGLKHSKCEICGYSDFIELHHVNGISTDNRIENLLILCPNCHSNTDNYRFKNSHTIKFNHKDPDYYFLSDEEAKQRDLETLARKRHKTVEELLNSKNREKKTYGTCKLCGKVLTVPRVKYCSHECYIADRKLVNRPSAILLINDLKEYKAFTRIGEKYNVSDNAVRKWCKLYMLPTNAKELLIFLESQNITPNIIRQNDKISYNKGNKNSSYGTKWMTNGIEHKKVLPDEIELYLENGWTFGKIKK